MMRKNVFLSVLALFAAVSMPASATDLDETRTIEVDGFGPTVREAEDDALRCARRQTPGLVDSDVAVDADELVLDSADLYNNAIVESWERIGPATRSRKTGLVKVRIRATIRCERPGAGLRKEVGGMEESLSSVRFSGRNLYAQIASRNDVADEIGPVLSNSFEAPVSELFTTSVAVKPDKTPEITFNPGSRTMSISIEVGIADRERFSEWADLLCDRLGRMCDSQDEVRFSGTIAKADLLPKGAGGELRKRDSSHANIRGVFEYQSGLCFGVMVPRDGYRWDFSDSKNYFRLRRYYFHHDKNESILEAMGRLPTPSLVVRVVAKDPNGNAIAEKKEVLPGSFLVAKLRQGWRIMPGWTSGDGKSAVATYRTRVELGPFRDEDVDRISTLESELER